MHFAIKSEIRNPKSPIETIRNRKTRNPQPATRNPYPATRNPYPATHPAPVKFAIKGKLFPP
jgi:hypothetical protein